LAGFPDALDGFVEDVDLGMHPSLLMPRQFRAGAGVPERTAGSEGRANRSRNPEPSPTANSGTSPATDVVEQFGKKE
jgi:hypothetical protein